jgi:ABC-2 type transport system permease protein
MRFFLALFATNLKASFALRVAFWMQVAFMALNNLLFFVVWWILFERFDEIRGYRIEDMCALFGVAATGYGLAAVLAGSLPELGKKIEDGDLDPILTQPKPVLVQAIAARTRPEGWGDIASGVFLMALCSSLSPAALFCVAISTTMFLAAGVLLHSAAFFIPRTGGLAREVGEYLMTFSVYPPTLFGGALRVALFTILPAGLISYVPAALLRDFDLVTAAELTAAVAIYCAVALGVFHRGLRTYESGNRFGTGR